MSLFLGHYLHLQAIKQPPGLASPAAVLRLATKLEQIEDTGILSLDFTWLNNNYQRSLTRYARRCSADKLRRLQANHRYTVLVCFLHQMYQDTIDHLTDMHDKVMNRVYNQAQKEIDEQTRKQRRVIRTSLATLRTLGRLILDETVDDEALREVLLSEVPKASLSEQLEPLA